MASDLESGAEQPERRRPKQRSRRQFDVPPQSELDVFNDWLDEVRATPLDEPLSLFAKAEMIRVLAWRAQRLGEQATPGDWDVLWQRQSAHRLETVQQEVADYARAIEEFLRAAKDLAPRRAAAAADSDDPDSQESSAALPKLSPSERLVANCEAPAGRLREILQALPHFLAAFAGGLPDTRVTAEQRVVAGGHAAFALGAIAGWEAATIYYAEELDKADTSRARGIKSGHKSSLEERRPDLYPALTKALLRIPDRDIAQADSLYYACLGYLPPEAYAPRSKKKQAENLTQEDDRPPISKRSFEDAFLPAAAASIGPMVSSAQESRGNGTLDRTQAIARVAEQLQEAHQLQAPPLAAVELLSDYFEAHREELFLRDFQVSGLPSFFSFFSSDPLEGALGALARFSAASGRSSSSPQRGATAAADD